MIAHKVTKLPKNTYQIEVTIPWNEVKGEYKAAFNLLLGQFELKGYRKGKVPMELAEKHIPRESVYQQLIRSYMPKVYEQVVKKEDLKPIVSPKIDLKKAKENEDWEIVFYVAEKPTVNLKNYKEAVKKAKTDAKKADIWVPGKGAAKPESTQSQSDDTALNNQKLLNEVLNAVLKEVELDISDLIIEEELNQRLSRLVDDIQKLGLTTDQYLTSKNLTMETLKQQYVKELTDMYKMEFILMAIAEQEHITVEQADLEKLFKGITDEKQRQDAQQNAYYYASILRKQKTLDYLTSL